MRALVPLAVAAAVLAMPLPPRVARADTPAIPRAGLRAEAAVGAMNLHHEDEHYAPMRYRGWLTTVAGRLAVERPHGRHALAFAYATGDLAARGIAPKAAREQADLAYRFERSLGQRPWFARPARLWAGGGWRTHAEDTKFASHSALGGPFESFAWRHALVAGATGEWFPRAGTRLAVEFEAALASLVARPPYSQPDRDFWGAAFAGGLRSPLAAPSVALGLSGRFALRGPFGIRAGYQFHWESIPDPFPLRQYTHLVLLGLDGEG